MEIEESAGVTTVIRDDFFNDPFFKDWWADFEAPKSVNETKIERQSSGNKQNHFTYP